MLDLELPGESCKIVMTYVCLQGPIENKRTLNLIQWTLQLFSLSLIFLSSYHQTASLSLALAILGWANIPATLKTKVQVRAILSHSVFYFDDFT